MSGLAIIIILAVAFLYIRNFYYAISSVNKGTTRLFTLIRIVGIFIPLLGLVLGFVSEPKVINV